MKPDPYAPCVTGIHVCGISADETSFVTADNLPMRSRVRARAAWRQIRAEFEDLPAADADLVIDLMEGGDCEETHGIRRQWLSRIKQIVEAQNG